MCQSGVKEGVSFDVSVDAIKGINFGYLSLSLTSGTLCKSLHRKLTSLPEMEIHVIFANQDIDFDVTACGIKILDKKNNFTPI